MAEASTADPETLVVFCRTREALKARERATRDDRAEQADAERTLRGLVTESMSRHDVECVSLGDSRYVQLVRPSRRACPLKTVDDVLALLDDDVAPQVEDVPAEALPDAVAKLVVARARARGPSPPPARAQLLTKKRGCNVTPVDQLLAPPETQHFLAQYTEAHRERREALAEMKPLREAHKQAAQALLPQLAAPASVQVTRQAAANTTADDPPPPPPRTLHLERRAAKSTASRGMGLRRVSKVLRAAAALAATDRAHFDDGLRAHVARLLSEEETNLPPPREYVKVTSLLTPAASKTP